LCWSLVRLVTYHLTNEATASSNVRKKFYVIAKVVKSDTTANATRVTVVFSGMGPDGNEQVQLGQYFIEKEGEKISRMVGFVGTGE
ncbi:MAG: hypothetical protein ABW121_22415, partial [Candidatus Thiodiazotropha sp. 6PLUC7]